MLWGYRKPKRVGKYFKLLSMKKLTFILGVIIVVALSSCSKEKDCRCVTSYSGTGSWDLDDVTLLIRIDEGDCSDGNITATTSGLTLTTTCTEQ